MSESKAGAGSCLCGAVQFNAAEVVQHVGSCHCGMCVKWSGPWLAVDCGSDVSFSAEDAITRYDSSDWAERGFCKHCGTHLFYHLKAADRYMMPPGLFDDQSDFSFSHQIFIDKKPDYYAFANDTDNLTEAEVFERSASAD